MNSGYAYELQPGKNDTDWRYSSQELWDIVCYTPKGDERAVGERNIDGTPCRVFLCGDGVYRAQTVVSLGG